MSVKRYKGICQLTEVYDSTDLMFVVSVRWVSKGASVGDQCILKDPEGNVIFESVAGAANWVDSFVIKKNLQLSIDTLDSGTVYLYDNSPES